MNNDDGRLGGLPININEEVPTPNQDADSIQALIKKSGDVTGYQLSNGEKISKSEGVRRAKNGEISGVAVGVSKKGEEYLRSLPDQDESNNLNTLPSIHE
ncbi:DUF3892 domain-containing protein [Inconstantimicrobium mannanitabidum]|uniref:Uncharacterized protein n=1 Tax=Inconstantimicrobium mannanitabidum TaxID=1604901 RepID=A0ACB5R7A1_9CLOT|nr:DUF3892 domain-containing protein [Clostridium sp. TW13]GKX65069.1 hypothetical protein rsdtw13_03270 [Clostridium sp. TW13]